MEHELFVAEQYVSLVKNIRNAELALGQVKHSITEDNKNRRCFLSVLSSIKKGDEIAE